MILSLTPYKLSPGLSTSWLLLWKVQNESNESVKRIQRAFEINLSWGSSEIATKYYKSRATVLTVGVHFNFSEFFTLPLSLFLFSLIFWCYFMLIARLSFLYPSLKHTHTHPTSLSFNYLNSIANPDSLHEPISEQGLQLYTTCNMDILFSHVFNLHWIHKYCCAKCLHTSCLICGNESHI